MLAGDHSHPVSDGVQSVRHCDDSRLPELVAYCGLYGLLRAGIHM